MKHYYFNIFPYNGIDALDSLLKLSKISFISLRSLINVHLLFLSNSSDSYYGWRVGEIKIVLARLGEIRRKLRFGEANLG